MSMKQITLDGRIGKGGAKVMKSNTGKEYVRFDLANDSFVDGANKTEWFNITCFDPYIVSKKSEYLTQGRYAIVQGTLKSEVTSKNGNIYLNHYVTAINIELPSFGKKDDDTPAVSTYTGGTKSDQTVAAQEQPAAPVQQTAPATQPAVSQASPAGWNNDDDLPF